MIAAAVLLNPQTYNIIDIAVPASLLKVWKLGAKDSGNSINFVGHIQMFSSLIQPKAVIDKKGTGYMPEGRNV